MIISLHMPKCGGTSFSELLKSHFKWKVSIDHDYPIHWTDAERRKHAESARKRIRFKYNYLYQYRFKKCIHGHFMPYKYIDFYGEDYNIFVTWLRDPIMRIVSHYYFWVRTYEKVRRPKPLHKKVIEEGWTLKEFAFSEELRNFYAKFLWKFPVQKFDFIGITEFYEQDIQYFAKEYLGLTKVPVHKKNVSPGQSNSGFEDEGLMRDLKIFHDQDYKIYNYALQARQSERIYS